MSTHKYVNYLYNLITLFTHCKGGDFMSFVLKELDMWCKTYQECSNSQCIFHCQGFCTKTVYSNISYTPQFSIQQCVRNPINFKDLPSRTYCVNVNYILNDEPYKTTIEITARTPYEARELVCADLKKQGAEIWGCSCRN